MHHSKLPFLFTALLAATGVTASHADPVLYDQPYSVGAYYTWASYTAPSGNVATGYDNFTLSSASSVTAVQWHGNYIAAIDQNTNPVEPGTTAFVIRFLADSGGQPGAVLSTETVPMADCQPQALGTTGFQFAANGPTYQIPFYSYRAALPAPFTAAAGQKYWISIVGTTDSDNINWSWYSGSGGDLSSIQDFHGEQTRQLDRNFTLEGVPATAPATPAVSAAATVAKANASTGAPAIITLSLNTPAASKLNVKYTVGGNAANGTDYVLLSGKAKIKPGQSSVEVRIVPKGDLGGATKKSVSLTLQNGNGYTVGTSATLKVKIVRSNLIILP